jgi:hypothetical protein
MSKSKQFEFQRTEEVKRLQDMALKGSSFVVAGKNGMGKRTLIRQAFKGIGSHYGLIELEATLCETELDLNKELMASTVGSGIDIELTETLSKNLALLASHGKARDKHLIIAINELHIEIPDKVIKVIESETHLSIVFHGTTNIGLFKKLFPIDMEAHWVECVDKNALYAHYSKKLKLDISMPVFEYLVKESGQSMQVIDKACWRMSNPIRKMVKIDNPLVDEALDVIVANSDGLLKILEKMLSTNQRKVLSYVAMMRGEPIFDSGNLKLVGFTKQQLQQYIKKLLEVGLVIKFDSGKYEINNQIFEKWLLKGDL